MCVCKFPRSVGNCLICVLTTQRPTSRPGYNLFAQSNAMMHRYKYNEYVTERIRLRITGGDAMGNEKCMQDIGHSAFSTARRRGERESRVKNGRRYETRITLACEMRQMRHYKDVAWNDCARADFDVLTMLGSGYA